VFRISFNSPYNWITNKPCPAITEKKEEVSHVLARKKSAKEGTGHLFGVATAAAETEKSTLAAHVVSRKEYTKVRTRFVISSPLQC
jgi:hypothetical protein